MSIPWLSNSWCSRDSGQMTVEFCVLMPVVVVVLLVTYNVVCYVSLCAQFDRCARDAVVSAGTSPSGKATQASAVQEITEILEASMQSKLCEIEVCSKAGAHTESSETGTLRFLISPLLTTYTCTMHYKPWPTNFQVAGMTIDFGARVDHTQTLVVDRFRAMVVA